MLYLSLNNPVQVQYIGALEELQFLSTCQLTYWVYATRVVSDIIVCIIVYGVLMIDTLHHRFIEYVYFIERPDWQILPIRTSASPTEPGIGMPSKRHVLCMFAFRIQEL